MSTSIDQAFIRQYERDVHDVFQRMGSRMRETVRHSSDVVGTSTTFQKIGKGTATTKARHGVITPMNQTHTAIECTLSDFYAGDWVDKLDEAKVNINEREAIARGGAWALGRKVDDQITTVLDTTTQTVVSWTVTSAAAIRNGALEMLEALFANDVPNDGQVYGALTAAAWHKLMIVQEFARADWVGMESPLADGPAGGQSGRKFKEWGGCKWFMQTGMPGAGTASAKVWVWHKDSVGYASARAAGNIAGRDSVSADITWHGDRAAHFVNHMMSGGAAMIDDTGVIEGSLNDTTALPTS